MSKVFEPIHISGLGYFRKILLLLVVTSARTIEIQTFSEDPFIKFHHDRAMLRTEDFNAESGIRV